VVDYAYEGPHAVHDNPNSPKCQDLREKAPICVKLAKACYNLNSRAACSDAEGYCWNDLFYPLHSECLKL